MSADENADPAVGKPAPAEDGAVVAAERGVSLTAARGADEEEDDDEEEDGAPLGDDDGELGKALERYVSFAEGRADPDEEEWSESDWTETDDDDEGYPDYEVFGRMTIKAQSEALVDIKEEDAREHAKRRPGTRGASRRRPRTRGQTADGKRGGGGEKATEAAPEAVGAL